MRLHIAIDDDVVAELDARVGHRQRSRFIVEALRRALADERRWEEIEAGLATIPDSGHDWDDDPAAWVRDQRSGDPRRVG
ncbi:MAG: hypothetical protein ACR2KK_15325 [Acidimicrobiales bacterium]